MLAGLQTSEGWPGAGCRVTHSVVRIRAWFFLLAAGGRLQFPCQVDLCKGQLGFPYEAITALPKWLKSTKQSLYDFYNLVFKVTAHHFHHILFVTKSSQPSRREGLSATS